MNMKKLFVLLVLTASIVWSCTKFDDSPIWDKINDHENRISELELKCRQMNTNIEALRALVEALQNNEYVTSVVPIVEDGVEIGYTITFSSGKYITIYHGRDGQDGASGSDGLPGTDGNDGHIPVIGVAKDTDGVYYWTVDGAWLLDENGQKVPATGPSDAPGTDGSNGQNGAPGADGKDGITPQLKIENGMWYVSYDDGATWTELGQATGDQGPQGEAGPTGPQGPQGNPGVGGDSMFSDVDYSSSADYVIFVLNNGTQIKIPTWSAFEVLKQQCEQMNANIEALQVIVNALQNNDYVKSVVPIYDGTTEVGYVIEFSKSGKVTIYHGKDGHTPVIGVAKDIDGVYYWTVDGAWLLDENGQKVPATGPAGAPGADGIPGTDGSNGQDGAPGADGKDGITPQLKIENGMWYVSYDDGATWTEVGQATGDQGPQGNPGVGGDSMFLDVDHSNMDYVIFFLNDGLGTEIVIPTWYAFESMMQACGQMNANIEALQTIVDALMNNDYVTGVTPIYDGLKEVGYVITFSMSGSVTIYHGKDGADGSNGQDGAPGADGNDGHIPVIGVAKDTDGVYYWTVDGAWLLDENGQKIPTTGKDGQNGSTGTPGQDGITPQLKIENGMWYVSYDEGQSWIEVGQATGNQGPQGEIGPQGPQGNPGQNGDSFLQSVTQDEENVYIVLADGVEIVIPKKPLPAIIITLGNVTDTMASFDGIVNKTAPDLKASVYYSTSDKLTIYKHLGSVTVIDFINDAFTLTISELSPNTTYYYFTEIICDGVVTYGKISSFRTGKNNAYVDWEDGENIGGEI